MRHVISINDLTNDEIGTVFDQADRYLATLGDPARPYRIARGGRSADGRILASLFYEPSTRTRLSFESAMLRLGGQVITSADPAVSSAAKGESLADTVKVIGSYADAIVIRHPRDGAARLAAEYSLVPVINGGDGGHEHPTQTLCDLFTLRRQHKTLSGMNVALSGDLKGSRTIHSFVYGLARFGANIVTMPAKGMGLPEHVAERLVTEFACANVPQADAQVDALYTTAQEPHQLSLIPQAPADLAQSVRDKIDAVYVTRFQKERWADKDQAYPRIDASFLQDPKFAAASVLHPLPRVGELDIAFDADSRAAYFQQAAHGVPIRMALIAGLLGLEGVQPLAQFDDGFRGDPALSYRKPHDVGLRCANRNCITHDPMDGQYAGNAFRLLTRQGAPPRLRCLYCETDIDRFIVGDDRTGGFVDNAAWSVPDSLEHITFKAPLWKDRPPVSAIGGG